VESGRGRVVSNVFRFNLCTVPNFVSLASGWDEKGVAMVFPRLRLQHHHNSGLQHASEVGKIRILSVTGIRDDGVWEVSGECRSDDGHGVNRKSSCQSAATAAILVSGKSGR